MGNKHGDKGDSKPRKGGTDENTEDWQNVGLGHWKRKTGIKPGAELPLGYYFHCDFTLPAPGNFQRQQ